MYTSALCKQTNNIYAVKKKRRDIYHKILIILDPFSLEKEATRTFLLRPLVWHFDDFGKESVMMDLT